MFESLEVVINPEAAAIVLALVQMIKMGLPKLDSQLLPLLTLVVSVAWVSLIAFAGGGFAAQVLIEGVITGLIASGAYSAVKATADKR